MPGEPIEGEIVSRAVTRRTADEVAERPRSPQVTVEAMEEVKGQLVILRQLVLDVLEKGIDWDKIPGTPAPSLLEPGAAKIISAFRCYSGERKILKLEDNADRISVVIEVPLVNIPTGRMTI